MWSRLEILRSQITSGQTEGLLHIQAPGPSTYFTGWIINMFVDLTIRIRQFRALFGIRDIHS